MKHLILTLMLVLSCGAASAQLIKEKEPIDSKYLSGAVPVIDGKVTFSRNIELAQATSAQAIYEKTGRWARLYFSDENILKRIGMGSDSIQHRREMGIVQYIVFKNTLLVLDRTQIIYRLTIIPSGNGLQVTMTDISYFYEEERNPQKFTAEEWITDEKSLNRKKTKFIHGQGKFRTKTIDLFDEICYSLNNYVNRQ